MNGLTQRHRAQQLLLRRATQQQVANAWPALEWADLDGTYPRLAVQLAAVVKVNRQTSSGLSAAYVREMRRQAKVAGSFAPDLAPSLVVDQFQASLHSTSVAHAKAAASRGVLPEVAMRNALTEASGAMARLVLEAGRNTIVQTVQRDAHASGWQRVLGGAGCDFCQMLAGRGDVYREETVDFEAHDHCGCTAEPIYRA